MGYTYIHTYKENLCCFYSFAWFIIPNICSFEFSTTEFVWLNKLWLLVLLIFLNWFTTVHFLNPLISIHITSNSLILSNIVTNQISLIWNPKCCNIENFLNATMIPQWKFLHHKTFLSTNSSWEFMHKI